MMCRKGLNRAAGALEAITIQPIESEFPTPSSMTSLRQRSFMPCTTQLPKKEDLDKWQDRSEQTLRHMQPKIQSLASQTQDVDYKACLSRLTAENEAKLAGTEETNEDEKRQDRYKRQAMRTQWSSPSNGDDFMQREDCKQFSQQMDETQEAASSKPSLGKRVLARIPLLR
jgi:hypothetical protein